MRRIGLALLVAPLALAACDLAPRYQVPQTPRPAPSYQQAGPWTPAAPNDDAFRGAWWTIFKDGELNALEAKVETGSNELAAYLARYDQAIASKNIARADLFPTVTAQGDVEKGRNLLYGNEYDYAGGGSLSYEVDLWGRVRNEVAAARGEMQASAADVANIRLSLQAQLAEDYANLRGEDAQIHLLSQTANAYAQALDLTQKRYVGGAASELDVDQARVQLTVAQSQLEQAEAARASYQDAIASLIGENATSFSIPIGTMMLEPPPIPLTAPSVLLQRRPDIAAAERRVAADNARIGEARAAFFPSLTLGSSGGYETIAGTIVKASGLIWEAGPASSMLTVFDAGRHFASSARHAAPSRSGGGLSPDRAECVPTGGGPARSGQSPRGCFAGGDGRGDGRDPQQRPGDGPVHAGRSRLSECRYRPNRRAADPARCDRSCHPAFGRLRRLDPRFGGRLGKRLIALS